MRRKRLAECGKVGTNAKARRSAARAVSRRLCVECLEDRRLLNVAPVTVHDEYSMDILEGTLSVAAPGVLANDIDQDGNPLTAELVDAPRHGSAILNVDGAFSYTPTNGFRGMDEFTYATSDGVMSSNASGRVRIMVEPPGLLMNISTSGLGSSVGSFPFVEAGGHLFFAANRSNRNDLS